MKPFVIVIFASMSVVAQAQSITPLMSANVKYSKLDTDNKHKPLLSPEKTAEGFFENVELLEIDNTLALRCEEGKSNEYGFIDEGSMHSIMFKISGLTYEWIDPIRQEGVLLKGTCSNNQLGYDLPFVLRFNISDPDILSVGHNVKTLEKCATTT